MSGYRGICSGGSHSVVSSSDATVLFRLPGKQEKNRMTGRWASHPDDTFLLDGGEGFIIAPFPGKYPVLWLETGEAPVSSAGKGMNDTTLPVLPDYPGDRFFPAFGEEEYKKQVEKIRNLIVGGSAGKVVLSRQFPVVLEAGFDPVRLFDILCEQYPDAFIYLAAIPGQGWWAGATPETLLRFGNGKLTTMALAGTRKSGEEGVWSQKDLEEHQFVVDYIELKLRSCGCSNIHKSGTATAGAGRVVHLKTAFRAECNPGQVASVVRALHPTPAVCGWPEERALEIIQATETHQRAYYTGYLGPVGKGTADLFVNLRCMQLFRDKAVLYTGGGLTSGSDPEREWEETVLKTTTMLSAIEKMRNLAD